MLRGMMTRLARLATRLVLLALIAASGVAGPRHASAEEPAPAATPEPVTLQGTDVVVTPPPAGWTPRVEVSAPGQWAVTWTAPGGEVVVQAIAFPHDGSPPGALDALLRQAVDTAFLSMRVDGVGMPVIGTIRILGMAGAEGDLEVAADGRRLGGHARLLQASPTHWAFAWGVARAEAEADLAHIKAFVGSLRPLHPILFTPTFHDPARDDDLLLQLRDEPPLLRRHMDATVRLAELALGGPLTLARREQFTTALLVEMARGPRALRDAVRAAEEAFAPQAGLRPEEQVAGRIQVGLALYRDHLDRRLRGDASAAPFLECWHEAERLLAGEGAEGLKALHVDAGLEMAAFLGSVAADAPRGVSEGERARLTAFWSQAFEGAEATQRALWRDLPVVWLRMRHHFDTASPPARRAFRRAVLEAVHPTEVGATLPEDMDATALSAWIGAHRPPGIEDLARSVVHWDGDRWAGLLTHLGDPAGEVPLGW